MKIMDDYSAIKRRMDELAGVRPVSVTVHIDARGADAGVVDRLADAMRGWARGGAVPPGKPYIIGVKGAEAFIPQVGMFIQVGSRIHRIKSVDGENFTVWPPLREEHTTQENRP